MSSSCTRRTATWPGRAKAAAWWTSSVCLAVILSLVSCEYNADLQVQISAWETGLSPVGVLGVSPHPGPGADAPPYDAQSCAARPDRLVIAFYLANDRDQAVAEGERLLVGGKVVRPTGEALGDPSNQDQSVAVDLVTLEGAAPEPIALSATVESVHWVEPARGGSPRLLLLHDHGSTTGAWDTADERIAALSEITDEALCRGGPTEGCSADERTEISLYRLADDTTAPLIERSRDGDALQTALTELRQAGERGRAPIIVESDGVTRGALPVALDECGVEGDPSCWPAAVLITAESLQDASRLDPSALPPGATIFAAGPGDSPGLRLLACETGGFYISVERAAELRQRVNRSTTTIPEYGYGFARAVLLALRGHWEAVVALSGLPEELPPSQVVSLSGTLTVTLRDQHIPTEFHATLGGY